MTDIVLASASPRRQRLMRWLGLRFCVAASDVEDRPGTVHAADPAEVARALALAKARDVADRDARDDAVVLGFDTLVVVDGEMLGKPRDAEDARRMLDLLSGRMHEVVTGVAAVRAGTVTAFEHETPVRMKDLAPAAVSSWLGGEEVLGCAGAYNIERHLAEVSLDQCFQNVAGLPLCHTYGLLAETFGLSPVWPERTCNAARGVRCEMALRLRLGDDGGKQLR
ncbi:MAG: septum formation protein Maf [Actinobacteria bacterium]|nr:MAG: septum formation protein Maf [Actinomycetota bacterium]